MFLLPSFTPCLFEISHPLKGVNCTRKVIGNSRNGLMGNSLVNLLPPINVKQYNMMRKFKVVYCFSRIPGSLICLEMRFLCFCYPLQQKRDLLSFEALARIVSTM